MRLSCRPLWCRARLGFATFEAGLSGLSILAEYEMIRHGHGRMGGWARVSMWGQSATQSCTTTKWIEPGSDGLSCIRGKPTEDLAGELLYSNGRLQWVRGKNLHDLHAGW
jgi:hypothetical protein